jgi:hypothetical protein
MTTDSGSGLRDLLSRDRSNLVCKLSPLHHVLKKTPLLLVIFEIF